MAELSTIARPYAEAAFALARDRNELPVWSEMLRFLNEVVADTRVGDALDSPKLTAGDKTSLLLSIAGDKLTREGRNFVRVLVEGDRIGVLPQIRAHFDARKDEAEGVAKATIESAQPLSDAQLASLKASLEKHFGRAIEATVAVNPELIGGARIVVGDTVIDGSVRSKLAAMERDLRA